MASDTYLTIAKESFGIFKEKGSKFYAHAFPVETENQIKQRLEEIKKKYHDARHHCYAYRLGKDKKVFKANDDGEPNHSAGDPILGQIKSNDLSDILIVVVRYFGGTKLGVGGLVQAYKTAAAEAIHENSIIEKIVTLTICINFDYAKMNDVMKVIKANRLEILSQKLDLACEMKILIRQDLSTSIIDIFKKIAVVKLVNH